MAASPPDTPVQPLTANTGTSILVSWSTPYNGGSPITALSIEIRTADGATFAAEPLYCNAASDPVVRERGYCPIPISVLRASPFSLAQGDLVVVRVSATNVVGTSAYSSSNPTPVEGTLGDDGVVNGDDGLGGSAPCLDSYIAVQES